MPGRISRSLRTVRDTSPDTVELRQADGMRQSSRVPNVLAQRPGSASTASSGENGVPAQRRGQLAVDRALAGPAVDEHDAGRVVVLGQVAQGDRVDAAAAHDRHGVVRQRRARARAAAQRRIRTPTGVPARASEASTMSGPRSASTSSATTPTACASLPRRLGERLVVEPQVRRVGLVLVRQRLGVVRPAALHGLLAFLRRRLQRDVGEVGEQPARPRRAGSCRTPARAAARAVLTA